MHTNSSHEQEFFVHDCLPRCVRRMAPTSIPYQVLHRVVEHLIPTLRSACRRSLQKRMLFIHKLIFLAPSLLSDDMTGDVASAWSTLRAVSGRDWIQRVSLVYPGTRMWPGGDLIGLGKKKITF